MIYVLTVIIFGQYHQIEMPDPATCRVGQALAVSEGAALARCEVVKYVVA